MPYVMLDSGCGIELHKHWDRSLRASRESQDSCPKVIPPEMHLCLTAIGQLSWSTKWHILKL